MPFVSKKKIQALTEGQFDDVNIENLLFVSRSASSIGGISNSYSTYSSQVTEGYRKYNGESSWGNDQYRSIVDIRTAFIAGEGYSIASKNERFIRWINKFAAANKAFGSMFFDAVLGSELTGKCLFSLTPKIGMYPKITRIPYSESAPYRVVLSNEWDPGSISDVMIKTKTGEQSLGLKNFVYIRTGGDDIDVNATTTKCGLCLNHVENYDRALKDLRRLNHVLARITPTFETKDQNETNNLINTLKLFRWKIGQAFIGTAKMKYEGVNTGAVENLKSEMATTIKSIASTSGIPVHWIGWTDLMSNRSTADSLYDTIGNATVRERALFSEGMYDLIIKAQELYIDSGGTEISTIETDFDIRIPLIDFSRFLDTVRALSVAYNDGVISRSDYQNMLPGIDPIQTEKALKTEKKEAEKSIIKTTVIPQEEDEDE